MVIVYSSIIGKCVNSLNLITGPKSEHQSNLSPFKNRLTENNDTNVVENGVAAEQNMVTGKAEGDANKYLHKKFKKVATLEETSPPKVRNDEEEEPDSSKRFCPYCKLVCAKPSVLEKHIRAHTGERPFPCHPCGFSFKTKSNLYKHRRSRAHSRRTNDGSSDDDDSSKSEMSPIQDPESPKNKIYKPKFHTANVYNMEGMEEQKPRLHLSIPSTIGSSVSMSTPFNSSSPSQEFLKMHITKLISDNQAIVDEVPWPLKTRYKDSPPQSPALRNGDTDTCAPSKLALALMKPHRSAAPDIGEPLNLTIKEPRKRSISESTLKSDDRITDSYGVKDFLLKSHSSGPIGERECEKVCPLCKTTFKSYESFRNHIGHCQESFLESQKTILVPQSPGPHLGNTPLVDSLNKDIDLPLAKRRKMDFRDINMRNEEKSQGKSIHLFGGEVQIHDSNAGKTKTLRIEPSRKEAFVESPIKKQEQILTISKTGLHCVGGTLIQQTPVAPPKSPIPEKLVLPIKSSIVTPTLSVPGLVAPVQVPLALNPMTNITGFNPLNLPKASPTNGGLVTIQHGGKSIPYVPGMPGPHTLLPSQQPVVSKKFDKPSVIVTSMKKSSDLTPKMSPTFTLDSDEKRDAEIKLITSSRESTATTPVPEVGEKKFLRPTSLPLKPGTYTPKRHISTPNHTLISPETPRPRKSYGQLYLNGHAYTYLGLKCSTRTFFCTLNKPQPIYVSLVPDQYKVSMYSNWKTCADSNPHPLGLEPRKAMSLYNSRKGTGMYTFASRNTEDIVTHSSYYLKKEKEDPKIEVEEKNPLSDSSSKKVKVCEGGFESNEEYIYIRGRGRGRYVCEECGIRCKKPSMLKKHIRTHTDLRPYTCKHCAFSFKTKGNLTKHMKSKAHYKKCVELGISPVPTICDDIPEDESEFKMDDGTNYSDNSPDGEESEDESDEDEEEEEEEEDDEEEDDESEDDEGDDCKTEREVAKSLLSLSEVALESAHKQYVKAGLVPAGGPSTYPYTISASKQVAEHNLDKSGKSESWRGSSDAISCSDSRDSSDTIVGSAENVPESSWPIDLSSKTTPPGRSSDQSKNILTPLTSVITSAGGQGLLLKTICSTSEKTPLVTGGITEPTENATLLQTYLTEKAAHDSRIKQRQVSSDDVTIGGDISGAIESARSVLALTMAEKPPSPKMKGKAEFMPPSNGPCVYISSTEDGRSMCKLCNKVFNKPSQLKIHVNIHFIERPFRCASCAVSFRTKGHLQKHQRSLTHLNKVNMNSTFGTATSSNPRPFKCDDCKSAFRIHGHLAKHLRSKLHIMKLECLGKLPFGIYAEIERAGMNMNDIDTTDCESSLESLQILAQKMHEKDPSKLDTWGPAGADNTSEDEPDIQKKTEHLLQISRNQILCQQVDGNSCNDIDDSLR